MGNIGNPFRPPSRSLRRIRNERRPSRLRLGTAPDSWGMWFAEDPQQVSWEQYLDDVANAGYIWTELGPQGFLPQDPQQLVTSWTNEG